MIDRDQFKYLAPSEIPEEIHDAAEKLYLYFETNGMREWQFSHVASRRLVNKLESENIKLRSALERISNGMSRSEVFNHAWVNYPDKPEKSYADIVNEALNQ